MKIADAPPAAESGRHAPPPGARMALILLLAINLLNYIDRQVLAAVVSPIREEFAKLPGGLAGEGTLLGRLMEGMQHILGSNPENTLIGLLAMAFLVSYMVTAPVFGWLAGYLPRWFLVGVGVMVWTWASGASGLAASFGMLLLTRCFVGVGEGAYGPVAPTMIADYYPVKVRGSVLAWFYAAIPVGSALGYILGGKIQSWFGWRMAFYAVVPPGLALGIWCFFMPEPPRGQADQVDADRATRARWSDLLILLRTPSYVLVTLGMTAMTFALGGIGFWMPAYIHEVRGQPDLGQVNLIFGAIVVVAGLSATLLGGIAGDRLRARFPGSYFLVSGAAMLVGFPFSVAMLHVAFPWAWIVIFLACFCLFFNTGPTNTILANVTHPAIRATGYALNIFVIHALGDVISPLVIGAVTDATGSMNFAFGLVAAMVLVGGVFWLAGARYLERDTQLAPTRLGTGA